MKVDIDSTPKVTINLDQARVSPIIHTVEGLPYVCSRELGELTRLSTPFNLDKFIVDRMMRNEYPVDHFVPAGYAKKNGTIIGCVLLDIEAITRLKSEYFSFRTRVAQEKLDETIQALAKASIIEAEFVEDPSRAIPDATMATPEISQPEPAVSPSRDLITTDAISLTMSSVEIADRTGKRHTDVMRDVRVQLGELLGEEGLSKFASSYRANNGKDEVCYRLPKRECFILVSGYSVKLRAAIIDRWQELEEKESVEQKSNFYIPQTYAEALRLAADRQDEIDQKNKRIAHLEPIKQAYQQMLDQPGEYCISRAFKETGIPPKKGWKFLREKGYIFEQGGIEVPRADLLEKGLIVIRQQRYAPGRYRPTLRTNKDGESFIVRAWNLTYKKIDKTMMVEDRSNTSQSTMNF